MYIVTGGAGFIGSVLAKYLSDEKVVIVDKFNKSKKWENVVNTNLYDFIDRDEFVNIIENDKIKHIKAILHMGACTDTTETNVDYLIKQNYEYSVKLCNYAIDNKIRFIYASSASVYGKGDAGFSDEEDRISMLKPLNPYGFSKWLFDNWVIKKGLSNKVVGLRFFNVFGPNEYHKNKMASVVCKAFPMAVKEGVVRLFRSSVKGVENGEQRRDFIYVKDVIKVINFFMNNEKISGIYNVGTGRARSFNELGHCILKSLNKKPIIEYFDMPEELKDKYQYITEADLTKLRAVGYKDEFMSLEDSVNDYISNYLLKSCHY